MIRVMFVSIGLVVLAAAVFEQTRGFDFVNYDDQGYVTAQPELRHGFSAEGLRWAVTLAYGGYMPLTGLSFLFDAGVHGMEPSGYHLTNVVLQATTAVLLFLFLYRTTGALWASALVAALFAVHPLRVESVAWISSRKDVLCGLFWMLTLHAYASYARRPGVMRYVLVLLGVCAALLSKPMAVTLPFVLLLLDRWPLRRVWATDEISGGGPGGHGGPPLPEAGARRTLKFRWLVLEKAPLLLPAIAVSVITMSIQRASGAVSTTESLPLSWRAANATVSYVAYLGKTVWPVDLVPLYPFPERGIPLAQVAIAGAVLAVITAAVLVVARRAPWAAVGWGWYLGTLVPVIGLVQVGAQSMADRYTYVPQMGVLVVFAWTLRALCMRWPRVAPVAAAASVCLIAALASVAHRQTGYWRDSVTLWSHASAITPESAIARSSLGEAYMRRGELEAARRELEAAMRLRPAHRATRLNMAQVAIRQGRLNDAFLYCRAMTIEWPEDPDANTAWASALIRYGLYEAALERLATALKTNPDHVEALSNRGAALLLLGRPAEALPSLQRALELAPDDAVILTNLAVAYQGLGRGDDAWRLTGEALRRDPAYEPALALQRKLRTEGR